MEKMYLLTESQLRDLLEDRNKLCALENGGIDNWTWYDECADDASEYDVKYELNFYEQYKKAIV